MSGDHRNVNGDKDQIETRLFINGEASHQCHPREYPRILTCPSWQFREASDGKTFKIKSPITFDVVSEGDSPTISKFHSQANAKNTVSEASIKDTNAAVAAAKAAQPAWAALTPNKRGVYMKKLADLIRQSHDELAYLEAISMGMPISSYHDSFAAAKDFDFFSQAGFSVKGSTSLHTPGFVNMTLKQP